MMDGILNVIEKPEGKPSEEIVHAGAREGGEVPFRLSERVGSGGNYLMPNSDYQMLICLIPRLWLHSGVNPYVTLTRKIYHGLRGWYV